MYIHKEASSQQNAFAVQMLDSVFSTQSKDFTSCLCYYLIPEAKWTELHIQVGLPASLPLSCF